MTLTAGILLKVGARVRDIKNGREYTVVDITREGVSVDGGEPEGEVLYAWLSAHNFLEELSP
jgi:hypothetical protein